MKKIIAVILSLVMMTAVFSFGVNAQIKEKSVVGTVVYIPYTTKAPDMTPGSIDESWGDVVLHIDKETKNAGMWAHMINSTKRAKPDDVEVDMYAMFDDKNMYFAFYSEDRNVLGGVIPWHGDSLSLMMEVDNPNLTYICPDDPERQGQDTAFGFGLVLDSDDYTAVPSEGLVEPSMEEYRGAFYIKFAIPFKEMGIKDQSLVDGQSINVNLLRTSATTVEADGYDGWLYWGNAFDQSLGVAPYYVADSPNAKGPNTFILKKTTTKAIVTDRLLSEAEYLSILGGGEQPAPEEEKVTLKSEPSSWAKTEVLGALDAGLIPEELSDGFSKGISRGDLAKILSKLLDKVCPNAAQKSDVTFIDTGDPDVIRAANLGIVNGYEQPDGRFMFKPENTLKRSEMTAIINRVAKLCGKTVEGFDSEVKFSDTASHWCNKELGWPVHNGIVKGTSATTFSPENTLTVEQTIMMIYRTYEALK